MPLVSMNQLSFKVSNAYKLETFSKEMWEVLDHANSVCHNTIVFAHFTIQTVQKVTAIPLLMWMVYN